MTSSWPAAAGALTAVLALAPQAGAQTVVRGTVTEKGRDAPIAGALIAARRAGLFITADRSGRFVLRLPGPDTLVVAAIGYQPDTTLIGSTAAVTLNVALTRAPVPLSDIMVTAPGRSDADLATLGQWVAPREAMRAVPFAIETDVFRSLSLVPAVSFSTPLSARPLIRGYDAGATTTRIDGFEVVNPYHIARAFASFPAEATERVSVSTAPQGSDVGGSLGGVIDITGRSAESRDLRGGAELSLASLTGWLGKGGAVPWFTAGRFATIPVANAAVPGQVIPYTFGDVYGKLLLPKGGRLTLFGSRDHLGAREKGSGADWGSALLGSRWPLLDHGSTLIEASASAAVFGLDVENLQTGLVSNDVRNRFGRVAAGFDGSHRWAGTRIGAGLTLGYRFIANRITDRNGTPGAGTDFRLNRPEPSAYLEVSHSFGGVTTEAGVRVDAAGSKAFVQPRFRMSYAPARNVTIGAAIGRSARFFQLVSNPLTEPDLDFAEYWLGSGGRGVPVPVVDHVSAEATATRGLIHARMSIFASRGRGIAELRVEKESLPGDTTRFRFGRSRTFGAEVQVAIRGSTTRASSLSFTYVLSASERNFGDGWIPWRLDRRHLVRILGQAQVSHRWSLFGAVEAATGMPFTPVDQIVYLQRPEIPDVTTAAFLFGRENSGRGGGTLRSDLGARFGFGGPGKSTMALGLSVTNLGFGPVAPIVFEGGIGPRISYKRLFKMPAIPTATLRIEF
jgi:hypothetical protein